MARSGRFPLRACEAEPGDVLDADGRVVLALVLEGAAPDADLARLARLVASALNAQAGTLPAIAAAV